MKKLAVLLAAVMTATAPVSAGSLYIGAEFDNEAVDYGVNKFTVFGENNTNESKTFRIVNSVSEDGRVISQTDGGTVTVAAGTTFSKNASVTIPETADLGTTKVDVYLWDGTEGSVPISQEITTKSVKFKYELEDDAMTSAGVYDKDGKLIKTLWSSQQSYSGENFGVWDGTDDANNLMPAGEYEIKILSHNVKYERDSAIGNNTTGTRTEEMISSYNTISDMCLSGSRMYIAEQYMEGGLTCAWFDISKPRQIAGSFEGRNTKINIRNATDGNYVYWMTTQLSPFTQDDGTVKKVTETFIYAVDPATPYNYYVAPTVSFEAGERRMDIWNVRDQFSAIGIVQYDTTSSVYQPGTFGFGDLAVQKSGSYLAATYGSRDFVRIMNKTTGLTLKDNSLKSPQALAFDNDDKLWVSYADGSGYALKRYTVNADGSLTENLAAPSSVCIDKILALDVNPSGTQLTVSYGGNTNKVISYNISDWSAVWSYGSGESYETDPAVYDNKLFFAQRDGLATVGASGFYEHTFIEYEDENTVWIGDPGNYRSIRLEISGATPTVGEMIYSPKQSYPVSSDPNDPTRVFLDDKEYEIDYTKSGSECWTLKNNWSYESRKLEGNTYYSMNSVTTLENGRTYFFGIDKTDGLYKIFELCEKEFRNTGIVVDGYVLQDGSFAINKAVSEKLNGVVGKALYRKSVTGFDEDNNPIYGEAERIAFVPLSLASQIGDRTEITKSGVLASLNPSIKNLRSETDPTDMRLTGYDTTGEMKTEFTWKTAPSTFTNNYYNFPTNGALEIGASVGNTVHFQPQIFGNNIVFAHTGEGYKQSQSEMFYHFTDDGLFVGVYGIAPLQQAEYDDYSKAVVNGNGFNWNMVFPDGEDGDTAYIYQGGEARYSGIMRFKVTGLNSIKTQSVKVTLGSNLRSGITAEVFEGDEYLITNAVAKTVKDKVELLNGGEGKESYGIRYTGYITKPSDADETTKIWIYTDGAATLKIGNVTKVKGTGLIGTAYEDNGEPLKIELTVMNNGKDISIVKMFYEANGKMKEYPMINLITENLGNENVRKTVDLLSNIPQDAEITENSYGWNFGDMIANATASEVVTNYTQSDYRENPDLSIDMQVYRNESTSIERSLGSVMENVNEWELSSQLMFLGKLNGYYTGVTANGNDQRFIDILDENDKIIARVEVRSDYGLYGNDTLVYQARVPSEYSGVDIKYLHEFTTFNPLKISCINGTLSIEYKGSSKSVALYDSSANWKKPSKLRISASKTSRATPYPDSFRTIFNSLSFTQSAATDSYLVTFYDSDRTTVLKRETVKAGESATAPTVVKHGFIVSWSSGFSNVNGNMSVYAVYTLDAKDYTVSFYDENGALITKATTSYGTTAQAPSMSKTGYTFLGWFLASGEAADLSKIYEDTAVYAKFQKSGTVSESFDSVTIDYDNKSISGGSFKISANDVLFETNSKDNEKVMSVKSIERAGSTTNVLYIDPYQSANAEEYTITFDPIISGKAEVSFDYKILNYAYSNKAFNQFGSLIDSSSKKTMVMMTETNAFGTLDPFTSKSSGTIRRVDNVLTDGKYSSWNDISSDNNWHHIAYQIDMDGKYYNLTLDGATIGTYSFYETVSSVDSLYFKGLDYLARLNTGRYYIDNIKVEYLK